MIESVVVSLPLWGLLGCAIWAARGTLTALRGIHGGLRDVPTDRIEALEGLTSDMRGALVELAADVDQLPHTWEEMHHKVRRTEERTRGAVKRAMAELEENGLESAELTEIGSQLQLGNGSGSPPAGMHPVPAGMGGFRMADQTAPEDAWRARANAVKFGLRG